MCVGFTVGGGSFFLFLCLSVIKLVIRHVSVCRVDGGIDALRGVVLATVITILMYFIFIALIYLSYWLYLLCYYTTTLIK
jgi:hypothetical protein